LLIYITDIMASDGGHDGDVEEGMAENKLTHDTDSDTPGVSPEAFHQAVTYDNLSIRLANADPNLESNFDSCESPAGTNNDHEEDAVDSCASPFGLVDDDPEDGPFGDWGIFDERGLFDEGPASKKRRIDDISAEDAARLTPKLQVKDYAVATLKDEYGDLLIDSLVIITKVFWRNGTWVCGAQSFKNTQDWRYGDTSSTDITTLTLPEKHFRKLPLKEWTPVEVSEEEKRLGLVPEIARVRLKAGEPGRVGATTFHLFHEVWRDEKDFKLKVIKSS
jgi:hypothetical protein